MTKKLLTERFQKLAGIKLLDEADDFERVHLEAEATKIAFYHRNKYLGDPKFSNVPVEKLLSKDYAKKLSKKISYKEKIKELDILPIENHKDTVYISVVDKDRNCVSFINSIKPFSSLVP